VVNGKWVQNFYRPVNPHKYVGELDKIVFRSSWERHFFQYCDRSSHILKWSSEPFPIPYWDPSTEKMRRYFPDVYVEMLKSDGKVKRYLIEIKPYKQTIEPQRRKKKTKTYLNECAVYSKNISKWDNARKFCEKHDIEFMILTEKDLGLDKK
jgi:hypothetical protein